MSVLFGNEVTKEALLKQVGDMAQVAGVRRVELRDGSERGVEAVEVRSGSGLVFAVLPGRGMDLAQAEYKGIPLAWRSPAGAAHAATYEPEGLGWLWGFAGGLMTTCGLTYFGAPCVDEGEPLGLHGRASFLQASGVWADAGWHDEVYEIWVRGKTREARLFGPNLQLTREITTTLGSKSLTIRDKVENLGRSLTPHMMLYHVNAGWPIVAQGAQVLAPCSGCEPRDEEAAKGKDRWDTMEAPTPGFVEQVFFHRMKADGQGWVTVALVNRQFNGGQGIGLTVKYRQATLPQFIQWKMNGEGHYVCGLEPATNLVTGRDKARADGTLSYLAPGEVREYELEIGVVDSSSEIENLEVSIRSVLE